MKYLINRKTKEHRISDNPEAYPYPDWKMAEADDEGWIAHTGKECPLPGDVFCELKLADGFLNTRVRAATSWWHNVGHHSIVAYRPILEAEPRPTEFQESFVKALQKRFYPEAPATKPKRLFDDLLERIDAAHAAAQALPDLVEQLRGRLKPLGLSVMYLSEFDAVEPESIKNPLSAKITLTSAEPDMSDWRNWKYGDKLECVNAAGCQHLVKGMVVTLAQENSVVPYFYYPDGRKGADDVARFRWHSRPAKGE